MASRLRASATLKSFAFVDEQRKNAEFLCQQNRLGFAKRCDDSLPRAPFDELR
jgi:hypothetical protein